MVTFTKKPGAPSGTIRFSVGGNSFVLDDDTHSTYSTSDSGIIAFLSGHPYLNKDSESSTYAPPVLFRTLEVVQDDYDIGDVITLTARGWEGKSLGSVIVNTVENYGVLLDGDQVVGDNVLPPGLFFTSATALTNLYINANEAPTGAPLTVRVRQGSTTLGTISLPAGQTSATLALSEAATISSGLVRFDVTSIGTGPDRRGHSCHHAYRFVGWWWNAG
jgi:hypothetical protein